MKLDLLLHPLHCCNISSKLSVFMDFALITSMIFTIILMYYDAVFEKCTPCKTKIALLANDASLYSDGAEPS